MRASLPMYDFDHLKSDHETFWTHIAAAFGAPDVPLSSPQDLMTHWQSQDLLLSQTCGMPFRLFLSDKVQYLCTPDFGLEGCPPGFYNSVFVAKKDLSLSTLCQGTFAYNEDHSQSGWAGPITHLDALGLVPSRGLKTGAHRNSARAVYDGAAEFAAIDAQTLFLLRETSDWAKELITIERTCPTPGLPYICADEIDAKAMLGAIRSGFDKLGLDAKSRLGIKGFVELQPQEYLDIPSPRSPDELFG